MQTRPDDRVLWARIAAAAARRTQGGVPAGQARSDALAELADAAAGRSDLLAEYAGIAVGFHEGQADEGLYLQAAQLCIEAGADTSLIPHWLAVGRRRARERERTARPTRGRPA